MKPATFTISIGNTNITMNFHRSSFKNILKNGIRWTLIPMGTKQTENKAEIDVLYNPLLVRGQDSADLFMTMALAMKVLECTPDETIKFINATLTDIKNGYRSAELF